jgi:transposase-like protein
MDLKRCRLTKKTQDKLAEFFVAGVTARTAADLLDLDRKTAAYFYHRLRQIIAAEMEKASPVAGCIEVDESYFGGYRKGKHGRGATGKVPVFGLLKRGGRVYWRSVATKGGGGKTAALTQATNYLRDARAESRIPDNAKQPTLNELEAPPLDILRTPENAAVRLGRSQNPRVTAKIERWPSSKWRHHVPLHICP